MSYSIETRPPDPTRSTPSWCSGGLSLGFHHDEETFDLAPVHPETQSSPTLASSNIPETCPLPSTQGPNPIDPLTTQSTLISVGSRSGSHSDVNDLLGAPVNEIPSNMVAPLLGSIYDDPTRSSSNSSFQTKSNFSPSRNPTLESSGKRSVILIQPLGGDGRDLLYNPVLTNKLLYDRTGIFSNKHPIKDLCINKVKGIIAIEYPSTVPWEFLQSLDLL